MEPRKLHDIDVVRLAVVDLVEEGLKHKVVVACTSGEISSAVIRQRALHQHAAVDEVRVEHGPDAILKRVTGAGVYNSAYHALVARPVARRVEGEAVY